MSENSRDGSNGNFPSNTVDIHNHTDPHSSELKAAHASVFQDDFFFGSDSDDDDSSADAEANGLYEKEITKLHSEPIINPAKQETENSNILRNHSDSQTVKSSIENSETIHPASKKPQRDVLGTATATATTTQPKPVPRPRPKPHPIPRKRPRPLSSSVSSTITTTSSTSIHVTLGKSITTWQQNQKRKYIGTSSSSSSLLHPPQSPNHISILTMTRPKSSSPHFNEHTLLPPLHVDVIPFSHPMYNQFIKEKNKVHDTTLKTHATITYPTNNNCNNDNHDTTTTSNIKQDSGVIQQIVHPGDACACYPMAPIHDASNSNTNHIPMVDCIAIYDESSNSYRLEIADVAITHE